jgi:HSP20 family protein
VKNSKINQLDQIRKRLPKADDVFNEMQKGLQRLFSGFEGLDFAKGFTPACDMVENDKSYLLTADLPGLKQEDIRVELHNRDLVISGERQEEKKDNQQSQHVIERHYGSFRRSITLPSDVDADEVQASFENGVLKIEIPKSEKARSRQIPIGQKKTSLYQGSLAEVDPGRTGTSSTRWGAMDAKNASDNHH